MVRLHLDWNVAPAPKTTQELNFIKIKKMATFKAVKEVFKHRGRTCVILELGFETQASLSIRLGGFGAPSSFHNGYVSVAPRHKGIDYDKFINKIDVEELTFSDNLEYEGIDKELWFLGFDTVHAYNIKATQTFEYAKKQTIKLADEMVDKGI